MTQETSIFIIVKKGGPVFLGSRRGEAYSQGCKERPDFRDLKKGGLVFIMKREGQSRLGL